MGKDIEFREISVHEGPEVSPGFMLWHISSVWRSRIELALKPYDLTHPQFVVLATLGWLTRGGEKVTQRAIGKMAGLDPNTASQIIKGLEKKNLIIREASLDARAKNPLLTKRGKQVLSIALPAVEKCDAVFFEVLTDKELSNFLKTFQKLVIPNNIFL
ncbi:MAG: MarR family transcriptional regulator [Parachlamydiales bacterium]|jgi:DNA-binding MarR family transcriptional regulator